MQERERERDDYFYFNSILSLDNYITCMLNQMVIKLNETELNNSQKKYFTF